MRARSWYSSRRGSVGHLEAIDEDLSRVGLEQADDVLDRDGFSGARVADDDHRLAFDDVEGEALEHLLGAEGFVDVDQLRSWREAGSGDAGAATAGELRMALLARPEM